jgi:hypothetical protein
MRFGIVHLDYESQRRTPRDSARWYRDVITRNGLPDRVDAVAATASERIDPTTDRDDDRAVASPGGRAP